MKGEQMMMTNKD